MASLRVGVDLDGVVADFTGGWISRYNAAFGAALTDDQAITWGAPAELTRFGTMSNFWRWARTCADDGRSLFSVLSPYPGAVDGLRALLDAAHVAIITTKPQWAIPDTLAWLAGLDLPLREVHITADKAAVDCDVYVEDSPRNLRALRTRRPGAVVCRWVRPWNEPLAGAVDVEDFDDVLVVVRALSAGKTQQVRRAGT
ncbi:MAG TPA: hypothetical protein VGD67_27070 [Pseudonocardiaceae bacterium]